MRLLPRPGIKAVRKRKETRWILPLSGFPASIRIDDIHAFWDNLKQGKDCITEIPKDRWKWEHYFSEDRTAPGAIYSKWGGFIDGIADFDPEFFKISLVKRNTLILRNGCFDACVDGGCGIYEDIT